MNKGEYIVAITAKGELLQKQVTHLLARNREQMLRIVELEKRNVSLANACQVALLALELCADRGCGVAQEAIKRVQQELCRT